MAEQIHSEVLRHTADIVSANLRHNQTETEALPQLIQSVHQALLSLSAASDIDVPTLKPAVPIRKSVFPDYMVCLEDGAKMKMLKRYIALRFGLTPAAYRQRWALPSDYPMVAPNYTEKRAALARKHGLGRKATVDQPVENAAEVAEAASVSKEPKIRTRRKASATEVEV
jgi:predicted transcriptional regulator